MLEYMIELSDKIGCEVSQLNQVVKNLQTFTNNKTIIKQYLDNNYKKLIINNDNCDIKTKGLYIS